MSSCGAPEQGQPAVETVNGTLIEGKITKSGTPVGGAYVRLLDGTGEFTAEVVSGTDGDFRFYAAPGEWELRALSTAGNTSSKITAEVGRNAASLILV